MTKKLLAVSFLSLILVACGGNSGNSSTLELSKRDKELANGNPNVAAEILVQKAILQESKNEKLTEEEQYNLDLAKQEVEVNFYLQKKFDKDFSTVSNVSDEEAKKYYDEHKAEIGNTPFETIKEAIINEIVYQKQTEIVHKYYDDLAEKYKINDILNKEYPEEAASADNAKTEEKKSVNTKAVCPERKELRVEPSGRSCRTEYLVVLTKMPIRICAVAPTTTLCLRVCLAGIPTLGRAKTAATGRYCR